MAKSPRRPPPPAAVTARSPVVSIVSPVSKTQPDHSAHAEALALFEQAMRMLQQHKYAQAAELFGHLTTIHAGERDLLERSRLFLAICFRQLSPLTSNPTDNRERLYAATLALNAGNLEEAACYLDRIRMDEPANDRALYMLAVLHSERRDPELAIRYLAQAIEANPENRSLARVDPDLDALRGAAGFTTLLS
jgi:outer membrane protein assembly factor BamD (BamD/ComL family)